MPDSVLRTPEQGLGPQEPPACVPQMQPDPLALALGFLSRQSPGENWDLVCNLTDHDQFRSLLCMEAGEPWAGPQLAAAESLSHSQPYSLTCKMG